MQTNISVLMICPNDECRGMLRRILEGQHANVTEKTAYPTYDSISHLVNSGCDAVLIEIDTDIDAALDVVEGLCRQNPHINVIVYSSARSADAMVRSMRTGAREFLSGVVSPALMSEALVRAAARRVENQSKKTLGKVLVFWGAKGGSGVTTLAANFALSLRSESGGEVVLLDLHPQLGDAAVFLGLKPEFTVADALTNPERLDEEFVSTLAAKHASGLHVVAAPDSYSSTVPVESRSIRKLLGFLQSRYPYVVVDASSGLGAGADAVVHMADQIYVVSQMDIPSLRNSQRFLAFLQRQRETGIELVLNRYEPGKADLDEERVTKALGVAPKWRVPNDYAAVRRAANNGTPLIAEKSPVSHTIREMARAACGKQPASRERKGFSLFR